MANRARERDAAEDDALVEEAVVADARGLADDDPHPMVDEHAAPDRRAGVNLDPGDEAVRMRDRARGERRAVGPEIVRRAMKPERVDAGIKERDLEGAARGGIVGAHSGEIFARARPIAAGMLRSQRSAAFIRAMREGFEGEGPASGRSLA